MSMSVHIDTGEREVRTQRQFRRSGNSTVVSIPAEILETADFETGDEVEVAAVFEEGQIRLRKPEEEPEDA